MVVWCPNCYRMLGEIAPYETLGVEYRLCSKCSKYSDELKTLLPERQKKLTKIMFSLWQAGKDFDLTTGLDLTDEALSLGLRPIDIAMGMLTPMLYQIGEQWKKNKVTVEHQHVFSAFVEVLFQQLERRTSQKTDFEKYDFLLYNIENNRHDLGIRILESWLAQSGFKARVLLPTPPRNEMKHFIEIAQPDFIGLSISMPEQLPELKDLVTWLRSNYDEANLQILIGGYAVKTGAVPNIPTTVLVPDLKMFEPTLNTPH